MSDDDAAAAEMHSECMALMAPGAQEHVVWCPAKHSFKGTYAPEGYKSSNPGPKRKNTSRDFDAGETKHTENCDKRHAMFYADRFRGDLEQFLVSLRNARSLALEYSEKGTAERIVRKRKLLHKPVRRAGVPSPSTTESTHSEPIDASLSTQNDTPPETPDADTPDA